MRTACGLLLLLWSSFARAGAPDDVVFQRIAATVERGEPVVAQVHVALCDNSILRCGGHGLGDGENPRSNLYWGTSEGLGGWLAEQRTGWHLVDEHAAHGDRALVSIWRRHVVPGPRLRARGIERAFDAYLGIDVWRGTKVDAAVEAFVGDVFGGATRSYPIAGSALSGGGTAEIVAWVGHDRFMDYEKYPWSKALALRGPKKGVLAIACYSRPYLKPALERAGHVPLLVTNDFVMASGAPLIGAINELLDGGDLIAQRRAATLEYARGQKKDAARLGRVFQNASSPGW